MIRHGYNILLNFNENEDKTQSSFFANTFQCNQTGRLVIMNEDDVNIIVNNVKKRSKRHQPHNEYSSKKNFYWFMLKHSNDGISYKIVLRVKIKIFD